jgi:Ser/Thr protein kinase RdoA (MazF antagonist)
MEATTMRETTTAGLPLIARGGQAAIYDYGDGKVLRVAGRPQDFDRIRYEYSVYASLEGSGLLMPRVHELVAVDGAPSIIMDKIAGRPMMALIASNPLAAGIMARELARLHLELRNVVATRALTTTKAKAEFCITHSEILTDQAKEKVLEVLKGLPDGDALCHGDFHPGNIICHDGKNYLIDWVGASRGDFHSDVAHTWVLLRVVPRVPHMSWIAHALQRRVARAMANRYLAGVFAHAAPDLTAFSRWVLVNAAERTYHGLPSEKEHLRAYIEMYLDVLKRGGSEDALYRAI